MSRMDMMFSWRKCLSSLISLRVRRQNMEWSKGVIRLIATLRWEGRCIAELERTERSGGGLGGRGSGRTRRCHRPPRR